MLHIRNFHDHEKPEIIIIPMIDVIFFLLVFFMLSMMYMVTQHTIPINLPQATSAQIDTKSSFTISLKNNDQIYLDEKPISLSMLLANAQTAQANDPNFAIIIRADRSIQYQKVISLMDALKRNGINRFGLATELPN